jgi:hypothetical protein
VLALLGAAPKPAPPISVVLNGQRLPLTPAPRIVGGHLMVPVRAIIEALGFRFAFDGKNVVTNIGSKTVTLREGSRNAFVDGNPVALDAPPKEVRGTLFAPLRFFSNLLSAQSTFDRKTSTVTVVAQLIGRSGNGITTSGDKVLQEGTVQAVDTNSNPPTITIAYNASVRTVQIAPNAQILLHDVNANVTVQGELADVSPGDYAKLSGPSSSVSDSVVDSYGSRVGTVAAVGANAIVLSDGHVVVPGRQTTVSIDGQAATLAQARIGDSATVRYNVNSGDVRDISLASASVTATPEPEPVTTVPFIASITTDATRPLRAGEWLDVTMRGTPGAAATFDVGPYVAGIAMAQPSPGLYTGRYKIPQGANFADVPVVGHLRVAGGAPPAAARAAGTVSASSTPPGIGDFAPGDGSTVGSERPAIFATFVSNAVAVNPSSATMTVNGHDVTAACVRNANFIQYVPANAYAAGPVRVTVTVSDLAGNQTTKTWTFTIRH